MKLVIIVKEMHTILKVLPDSNWPSVTCLMICINRNLRLISALRNGWKLISPSKSFVVYAATSTEKHQWMSHIKKCVDDLLIKRMYPVLASMPVWFFPPKNKKPILLQYQGHSWRSRSSSRPMSYLLRLNNYMIKWIKSLGWPLRYQNRSVLLSEVKAIQQW